MSAAQTRVSFAIDLDNPVPRGTRRPDVAHFWRDDSLPFIEARFVEDGRKVCYARHSHETFSIGSITHGCSFYLNGKVREIVHPGTVVVMNPEDAHACNPIAGNAWSYRMLYVDTLWLTRLQHEMGHSENRDFRAFSTAVSSDPMLYDGLNRLCGVLVDSQLDARQKHSAAVTFFVDVQQRLDPARAPLREENRKLVRAAEFINDNFRHTFTLDDVCAAADLSVAYLIRAFKARYGMTPHAYQIDRRVRYSRRQLRRGQPIADVALAAGFADQAHLQHAFKRLMASTPGRYRTASRAM